MVLKKTTWQPDTCDCVVEYAWDNETPEETRTHTHLRTIVECPEHSGIKGQALLKTIEDESARVQIFQSVLINHPDMTNVVKDVELEDGSMAKSLKKGYAVTYKFTGQDDKRKLHVSLAGRIALNAQQKKVLQDEMDAKVGAERVAVE